MNSFAIWFILIAILILAVVGILYLAFARATPKLNVTKFRTQWLAIENSFSKVIRRAGTLQFSMPINLLTKLCAKADTKVRRWVNV